MKLKFSLIGLMAIGMLIGCGGNGGGSDSEPATVENVSKRSFIFVFHHFPKDSCTTTYLKKILVRNNRATDLIAQVTTNDVSCATYGKREGILYDECLSSDSEYEGEPACVFGYNHSNTSRKIDNMYEKGLFLEDIHDRIISDL